MTNKFSAILTALADAPLAANELCRIFHGRGHSVTELSHINLDFYPPALFLVSYQEIENDELTQLTDTIWQWTQEHVPELINTLVYQQRSGINTRNTLIYGELPQEHVVTENSIKFKVDLLSRQNTGIFPDMRRGREFVQANSNNAKVLNLFSYTCGFSVAAMQGGADQVINMDMNKGVLRTGKQNHQLNGFTHGVSFYPHDILKSFGKLKKSAPYELIIVDPPSFQKGSFILTKDYQKILRRLPELLNENTQLLLCANSPELSEQAFKDLITEHTQGAISFVERLAPTEGFVEVDSDRSLKALVYKSA
ncbi:MULTISPECIES: class I SAM-dependent methyltransferase [unclassified Pseudoalteromonas]|uniref:class I SAM-dependent methyltransferase n=1 Tax=unclassified Pseudoalteromonas TaxID=194690 RepID=UPI0018810D45|nr:MULTISPECIES: class I SAM-dependent methyltransferase [Gammaproteobacteria]MCF7516705.1 class I SAM-dependent methyltransferase [Pseudoalteromonas sp. L21]UJX24414.1 class I SAM-dependent methyltransferase [Pseudoalteromonas sp. CF6-2]|tara:strand:- start:25264 stop:26190 length:927 start_codon:yes stop_codon:yes gene_type:complete